MRFTLSWLKQFLDTNYSVWEIADALTSIGLEVEEIIDKNKDLQDFEVAHIISTEPHRQADKLKLCRVQTKNGVVQIVCGASNARSDLKVVLAKIGSEIPNGKFKIKESVIKGEKSGGMLCSEAELLLSLESEGIIELPTNATVGESFTKYYGLDDPVFNINVTPNRGDALGVYGIARDLSAKGLGDLKELKIPEIKSKYTPKTRVIVKDKAACPLFTFIEIKNLKNKPSPEWLQNLLKNINVKTISAIVDVTNYISYSFGQPMHAYDLDKLKGDIIVESVSSLPRDIKALNGRDYKLEVGDLVVRDDSNIQSLAGIIGSSFSSCSIGTTNILLEAACFDAKTIANSGRRLQIDTDSRYRFERNIDRNFTEKALRVAASLISSICESSQISQIVTIGDVTIGDAQTASKSLDFPINYLEKVTGLKLNSHEICNILNRLGFKTLIKGDIINILVPSWRHDISILEDIVEEITRIYGYDQLPSFKVPQMEPGATISKEQKRVAVFKRILANSGYDEVVSNSFINSEEAKLFTDIQEELFLLNPISCDNDYMRPTIIPNLLRFIEKNLARSIKNMAFFEIGPIFSGLQPTDELTFVSGVRCGAYMDKNAHTNGRDYDIFDLKADLETLFDYIGISIDKCALNLLAPSYYHPARAASIALGSNIIGYFGQIHPQVLKYFGISEAVFAFELNIMNIPFAKAKFGKRGELQVSDFQMNFRDYAFVLDPNQSVGEIINYISNFNKKLVKSVRLFDIYSGDKLAENKKSIAIKVQLQADDRTLTEQDLNKFSTDLILAVEQKFQGKLRG